MAFVQSVIKGRRLATATADGLAVAPRQHLNLDVFVPLSINETDLAVDKGLELVTLVEDSLYLHLLSLGYGSD